MAKIKLTQPEVAAVLDLVEYGKIDPHRLVEEAKDTQHILHRHFVWDDKYCGEQHRLNRARTIIASVMAIETTTTHYEFKKTPYLVHVPDKNQTAGYRSIDTLRHNPSSARKAVRYAITMALGNLERAMALASALDVEEELSIVVLQLRSIEERLKAVEEEGRDKSIA